MRREGSLALNGDHGVDGNAGEGGAAREEGELDEGGGLFDVGPEGAHEADGGGERAAGGEEIIDDHDTVALAECVAVDLQRVGAVLEGVLLAQGGGGQFAGLADGHETDAEAVGQGGAEDEPATLDADDGRQAALGVALGEVVDRLAKAAGVAQKRGDILEHNPRLGEIGDGADEIGQLAHGASPRSGFRRPTVGPRTSPGKGKGPGGGADPQAVATHAKGRDSARAAEEDDLPEVKTMRPLLAALAAALAISGAQAQYRPPALEQALEQFRQTTATPVSPSAPPAVAPAPPPPPIPAPSATAEVEEMQRRLEELRREEEVLRQAIEARRPTPPQGAGALPAPAPPAPISPPPGIVEPIMPPAQAPLLQSLTLPPPAASVPPPPPAQPVAASPPPASPSPPADSTYDTARPLFDRGDLAGARAALGQPRSAAEWNLLGRIEMNSGNPAGAVGPFQQAVQLDPSQAWYFNNLGYALLQSGHGAEAVAPLERAVTLDADESVIWNNLGLARRAAGNAEGARSAFERALQFDPGNSVARDRLDALMRPVPSPPPAVPMPPAVN